MSAAAREVLITGCSSGIGLASARVLAARGWRVFATARRGEDVERLAAEGFESLALDVADASSIEAALDAILARTGGRLHALFNNAGYGQPGAVEDLRPDVLRAQFDVNFFGLHELTWRVLPVMRRAGAGRIVHNSSVLGLVAMRWRGAYNASKFAIEGLADTLRQELAGSGVHVSLIEPGPIESRFRANARDAFHRNVDVEASPHREAYRGVARRLAADDEAPFTLPSEAVAGKLVHALEHPRPRPRYYVTVPTYGLAFLKRVLGTRALDRVLAAATARETR